MPKQYRQSDKEEFYEHYGELVLRHQDAMTGEQLHSKIDIAYELAFRDKRIEMLEKSLQQATEKL